MEKRGKYEGKKAGNVRGIKGGKREGGKGRNFPAPGQILTNPEPVDVLMRLLSLFSEKKWGLREKKLILRGNLAKKKS